MIRITTALFPAILFIITGCTTQPKKSTETPMHNHTNRLIHQSSPYLLQHAHNPVDWEPWGPEALERAKKEDKPIIVSIGYAACHWCHVMEHESFENEAVAAVMNTHFVCIKVDREERPDVDQIYMDALHAMGQQGGWPLNVFLTPDAKPFYGGTYFSASNWTKICENVARAFAEQRPKIEESADLITQGIAASSLPSFAPDQEVAFPTETLHQAFFELQKGFDQRHGGFGSAPKFPMPCNFFYLLHYERMNVDSDALEMTLTSLDEMAYGGIYDQIGGGFARYSTDARWFAPHFEKMLYDNGQLISLYATAYRFAPQQRYRDVVEETIAFAERELLSPEGGFYSSLDADSEGEEGKFYCWTEEEIKAMLADDAVLFQRYYNTQAHGNWEEKNILYRRVSDEAFAKEASIPLDALQQKVANWKKTMLLERAKRIRPGLDDKILASWNGLMLSGLCDAYRTFGDEHHLQLAITNALFITDKMIQKGKLYHNYKNGKATIDGFLEDYAAVIGGFIQLYQVTFEERWLLKANELTEYAVHHFYDQEEQLFFFTDEQSAALIARKKELFDNVIPSSNALMAENLHHLGLYFDRADYQQMSDTMVLRLAPMFAKNIRYTTHWARVFALKATPTAEIAIVGPEWKKKLQALQKSPVMNAIYLGGATGSSTLPLLEGKEGNQETVMYVCYNKTCRLPVKEVQQALKQLE